MKKIISLFQRYYEGNRQVYNEVVPGAEWVQAGEGVPTVKFDGTCCMVRDGKLYKRYTARYAPVSKGANEFTTSPVHRLPDGFEPVTEIDLNTGKQEGWVPVGDGPDDVWHREALEGEGPLLDGTYELIGPKVQGNPYDLKKHHLIRHGGIDLEAAPTDFEGLRVFFINNPGLEGIVWHHPDGRMVKIKRRDFGLPWPVPKVEA